MCAEEQYINWWVRRLVQMPYTAKSIQHILLRMDRFLGFESMRLDNVEPSVGWNADDLMIQVQTAVESYNRSKIKVSISKCTSSDDTPSTYDRGEYQMFLYIIIIYQNCPVSFTMGMFKSTMSSKLCIEVRDPTNTTRKVVDYIDSTQINGSTFDGISRCLRTIEGWVYYVPWFMLCWNQASEPWRAKLPGPLIEKTMSYWRMGLSKFDLQYYTFTDRDNKIWTVRLGLGDGTDWRYLDARGSMEGREHEGLFFVVLDPDECKYRSKPWKFSIGIDNDADVSNAILEIKNCLEFIFDHPVPRDNQE